MKSSLICFMSCFFIFWPHFVRACPFEFLFDQQFYNPELEESKQWKKFNVSPSPTFDLGRIKGSTKDQVSLGFRLKNLSKTKPIAMSKFVLSNTIDFQIVGYASVIPAGGHVEFAIKRLLGVSGEKQGDLSIEMCGQSFQLKLRGLTEEQQ